MKANSPRAMPASGNRGGFLLFVRMERLWTGRQIEAVTLVVVYELSLLLALQRAWNEGVTGLRGKRVYSLQEWIPSSAFEGFSDPLPHSSGKAVIGRTEGLARRS
jgi:hypothetical protein